MNNDNKSKYQSVLKAKYCSMMEANIDQLWQENHWGRGGLQEARYRFLASGGRDFWWLALCCTARGEEVGSCPLKAHGSGGRRGYLPPVEQDGHPPSARQRRHPRQPGACPALGAHRQNYLKCNTFMKPLECTLFALSHVDDQFVHYSLKYTPHTK